MRYKIVSTNKRNKTKSPFIIPLMYYIFGFLLLLVMAIIIYSEVQDISDFIEISPIIVVLGGFGILALIVGYKRRKW
ncbi:MAG: hypothetical protein ACYDG2_20170 [Ruminiclostridium sp.]